ncbi:branched-chain amino acid ABC transporter permease [Natronomonas gomsonensis]|uniref:branched-chain amino acid ABC transporter permease n=1 Tax=Natronomonas gomsonensis TaxID=1046043 RepID=UPI0020CA71CD|nr:branched-chain amino acid ABC transporter permease [Natronomonas gomsonensis]MCY4729938.1 branched-chain amino acid ABC transporter permease [Natronomonas gomsonensis]
MAIAQITVNTLLTQALHGLVFGMILLLLSLGLSLIFGIAGVVNFAHGALYMVGAYVTFVVSSEFTNVLGGLVAAFVVVALIGGIAEVLVLRPLYDRDALFQLLATFGMVFIIDGAIINIFGVETHRVATPEFAQGPLMLGDLIYPKYRLALVGISALFTIGLWMLLEFTDYGVRVRAATFSSEMVDALGTNTKTLLTGTFMLGAGLAGIAGGFAAPVFTVYPAMGLNIIILVFIVVVVGGLGSFRGAVIGSLIVGESIMLGRVFISEYSAVVPYIAMIAILMVRPHGLLGREMEVE